MISVEYQHFDTNKSFIMKDVVDVMRVQQLRDNMPTITHVTDYK